MLHSLSLFIMLLEFSFIKEQFVMFSWDSVFLMIESFAFSFMKVEFWMFVIVCPNNFIVDPWREVLFWNVQLIILITLF